MGRFADRPAISVRREQSVDRYTYAQLATLADAAAVSLAEAGVTAGDRCAILAENSARWCATYLGILRLGAVAVPFDTTYKPEQVAVLLADCGARVIVASERFAALAGAAAPPGCPVVGLDAITTAHGAPSHPAPCPSSSSDPAVILYTSGTTSDPKGVVLTHGNLLAEKEGAFQIVAVDERDVVLGVLPLFHALAQMANLLLPFSLGAHVVFLETLNTTSLLAALQEEAITVFCCVPQFFYLIHQRVMTEVARGSLLTRIAFKTLLRANATLRPLGVNIGPIAFARVHRTLGPRMRLLITGGSKFDPAIGQDLDDMGFTILQAYGLTETSGAATVTRPGEPIATVGRPLPGSEIRIAPPAAGFSDGEVLIRGPIVMAGYWNKPDATAAVMRDGWFYSGDLGQLDADGRLTITGRSKEIIVLQSGKNIYPEEIERHYARSAFIRELCVMGITDPSAPSAERLHAVVVPDIDVLRERKVTNVLELIRFELEGLSVSMPGHKRVLGFDISMAPLPRTTTQKLKRHEIQRAFAAGAAGRGMPPRETDRAGQLGEPGGEPEHVVTMVTAVRELISKPVTVRADSNFELDLGLDSMERVELLAALEQRFGCRIGDEAAQRAFTVRQLAEAFQDPATRLTENDASWPALLRSNPLTPEQQRLLKSDRPFAALLLFLAARLLRLLVFRTKASGIEHLPDGPFILSPNHQSYLDPFAVVGTLPFRVFRRLFFVGAAEYFETPLTAWLARRCNVVPVDADARLLPAMQAGAFGLRAGKVLVLFPEGERSIDGTVRKFKKGAGLLSEHVDVPIVPVAINGLYEMWPRNRPIAWSRVLPFGGHRVRVAFGKPLPPARRDELRSAVEAMWHEL